MEEYDYKKNKSIDLDNIRAGSHTKIWWICSKGHEWKISPNMRTSGKSIGCPFCSNRKVLIGYNDLKTTNPKLASEWNYDKNKSEKPEMFTSGSSKKVWWKCNKGHEWEASIGSRKKRGCPICRYETQTSFPEQAIYYYMKHIFPNCKTRAKVNNIEVDILIDDIKLGIEYDGESWHKDIEKDYNKIK